jgi:hypothetical protein
MGENEMSDERIEEARNDALEQHLDAVQSDDSDTQEVEQPQEPDHGNYDVKAQSATEADADYDVEETNPKVVTDE